MKRQAKFTATILLALTFSLGGLAGMAFEEGLGLDWFEFLDADPAPGQAILADLHLSESQKLEIENIFEQQEDDLEDYWEGRLPELKTIVEKADNQIRTVLTPQQRVIFDERIKHRGSLSLREAQPSSVEGSGS